ncbi:MAG: OmcA/MtrC family decaheme c-type cytochrome [Candidatus Hydrogenedentes bacterium]|nr:OmcA/MtrC family decaheme c-type cytochrome [Candidatus Hydrogenedentota bacterium]
MACISVLALTTLALCGCPGFPLPTPTPTPTPTDQPPGSAVAPGLNVTITSVTIPSDLKPVVKFTAKDNKGNIIPLNELTDCRFALGYLETPGTGSTARVINYTTRVSSGYTQATSDSARLTGLTQTNDGVFTYKFVTAVPAGYSKSATHQLGGQLRRQDVVDGLIYPTNVVFNFRPDGGTKTLATRAIVDTATCNACHTRLSAHGTRREVQYCIMCHNTQTSDSSNGGSLDFPVMIHKIHMGKDLPSVVAGDPYVVQGRDYSTVAFPQDVRNCTTCHQSAPQANVYVTTPTLAGCAACHDRTWFGNPDLTPAGFTAHVGGSQSNDQLCALCHTESLSGSVPILTSHLLPEESEGAIGLALAITDVTTTPPVTKAGGTTLKVSFTVQDKDGNPITDLSTLSRLAINCAWPAAEYTTQKSETLAGGAVTGTLVNNGGGAYDYTFTAELPATSSDTFAVALEGRRNFTFRGATYRQGPSSNGLTYFTIDGSDPVARRQIVDDEKCNKCHKDLHLHGANRMGVDYCAFCHKPDGTDISRRPAGSTPESIHFKTMIHKIHTGENLSEAFEIYGFGGTAIGFNEVRFPGDRSQCTVCHVTNSTNLPVPDVSLPTVATVDNEIQPTRAACNSCHDSLAANIHALLQTSADGVESCEVCHGTAAEYAVAIVHKQTP